MESIFFKDGYVVVESKLVTDKQFSAIFGQNLKSQISKSLKVMVLLDIGI